MKKLNKNVTALEESLEVYSTGRCSCNCMGYCNCSCWGFNLKEVGYSNQFVSYDNVADSSSNAILLG